MPALVPLVCSIAVGKMKKLGAISEETAKKPDELNINEWLLERLVDSDWGVKVTLDGRYYVPCKDGKH